MAKNVRISDELYVLAQAESALQDRSIAQQLEHWAKLGLSASLSSGDVGAVKAAIDMTHQLDRLDVLSGRRSADYLHFIPRSMLKGAKAIFPEKYQSS